MNGERGRIIGLAFTKIAVRNIPRRKLRNFLTAIGIIIGVSLVVGVNVAGESSFVEYRNFLRALTGQADIIITSTPGTPFDERTKFVAVRGISGIEATGRLGAGAFISEDSSEEAVRILGVDSRRDFEYVSYRFDGKSVLRATDVTVSKAIVDELEVEMGGYLDIRTTTDRRLRLHVVGVYHPRVDIGTYQIFMDIRAAQQFFNYPRQLTDVIVKVEDAGRTEFVQKAIERNLGSDFKVRAMKEDIEAEQSNLEGWRQGLNIMSMVALFVCLGLVVNTMYMNVSERTYEIGVLKALGASRRRIFWLFFCEAVVLGLVGVFVGLVLGVAMARGLYYFTSLMAIAGIETRIEELVLKPDYFILGASAGLIATMAGGLIPSISAARIDIIRALKPSMRPPGKQRTALLLLLIGAPLSTLGYLLSTAPVETYLVDLGLIIIGLVLITAGVLRVGSPLIDVGLSPLARGAFDAVGKVLSKNLGRNLKRAAVTYATIGICVTFLIMMGGMEVSVAKHVDNTVRQYFGAHITVVVGQPTATTPPTPLPTSFAKSLVKVDPAKIDTVTYIGYSGTKSEDTDIGLMIIDPDTFPKVFDKFEFTDDTPKDVYTRLGKSLQAIILVEPLADSLEVSVGHRISVYTSSGIKRFAVVGIIKDPGVSFSMGGGFLISEAAFVSYRTARTYFLPPDEQPTANLFAVNVKDEGQIDVVKDEIEREYGDTHDLQMFTLNDLMDEIRGSIQQLFSVFNLILYMAIISATAGIATTMVMNVNERLREIGILRAQGMKRRHIFAMIIGEAVFLGFFGFLVGLPSGLMILRGTILFMSRLGMSLTYIVPLERVGVSLVLALAAAMVGATYPSYRAVKARPVEVLRYRG